MWQFATLMFPYQDVNKFNRFFGASYCLSPKEGVPNNVETSSLCSWLTAMAQKYAHFSPGHLADVVNLNPLAGRGHTVDTSKCCER